MDEELESKITQIMGLLKNQFGGGDNQEDNGESGHGSSQEGSQETSILGNAMNDDTLQMMLKMKRIMDQQNRKDDPAKNLLLAIKPFLKESRQTRVNHCIQFLSLSKVAQYSDLFQLK